MSSPLNALSVNDGVGVGYASVGGAYSEPALRAMAWEGRFLVVGFPAGIAQILMNPPLLKGCNIVCVFWGAFVYRAPKGHAENMAELFALYEQGMIKPRISETLKMQDAATALNLVQDRKALGKIVLTND